MAQVSEIKKTPGNRMTGYEYEKGAKFVAYVSSYTRGKGEKYGIRIYDVDMENGYLIEKQQIEISNSSYVTISHNRKYLYSITDFGIEAYRIIKGGDLEQINLASINGMRGSYLSTDYEDEFLFVSGYHDGKITVLRLNEDGSVGDICDELFLKGLGSIAERNFRPHVQCVKMISEWITSMCIPSTERTDTSNSARSFIPNSNRLPGILSSPRTAISSTLSMSSRTSSMCIFITK